MSGEQRDNNLGIDSDLRSRDPGEYHRQLSKKLDELKAHWGDDDVSTPEKLPKTGNADDPRSAETP